MNALETRVWKAIAEPSRTAPSEVPASLIRGKRVLVTGAGGSIGSALAAAVAAFGAERVILFDASEQALYRVDRDFTAPHEAILASAGDVSVLKELFEWHRPQIIFHAAAFKHLPLMERQPFAALSNNVLATFALAQVAVRHGMEQMVLVSTDKAAAPTSIMGASKRVAEMTALALATHGTTGATIKAVRLGNVYASQGSVVPLFEEQIAMGRPLTVTHPGATRYFVSIEQAAALLLCSLSDGYASGVLVPDLPEPVRIQKIAEAIIQAAGSTSRIVYTGLRPGEKLREQLIGPDESYVDADATLLRAVRSPAISVGEAADVVAELRRVIKWRDLGALLNVVRRLIPGYEPSETVLALQAVAEPRA